MVSNFILYNQESLSQRKLQGLFWSYRMGSKTALFQSSSTHCSQNRTTEYWCALHIQFTLPGYKRPLQKTHVRINTQKYKIIMCNALCLLGCLWILQICANMFPGVMDNGFLFCRLINDEGLSFPAWLCNTSSKVDND